MIRVKKDKKRVSNTCPHTRGDDPLRFVVLLRVFSLVPTRVGMILTEVLTKL